MALSRLIIPGQREPGFDPVKAARDKLAKAGVDPTAYRLMNNQLLIAPHTLPDATAGGIIRSDQSKAEDRWQGKVGLVIAAGPTAFQDDAVNKFGGARAEIGDWVVTRPTDGFEVQLGGIRGAVCKIVEDTHVRMVVPDPDAVY